MKRILAIAFLAIVCGTSCRTNPADRHPYLSVEETRRILDAHYAPVTTRIMYRHAFCR